MRKEEFSVSGLIGISLAFLAVGLSLIIPERFPTSLIAFDSVLRWIGWATIIIAAFFFIGAILKWAGNIFRDSLLHVSVSSLAERLIDFEDSYALSSDLSEICLLGDAAIGENHPTEDLLRNRIEKCPHIIKKLTPNSSRTAICGYYIAYPLTTKGVNRIDKKQIVSGKSLVDTDIAANFKTAKAVYISMISGNGIMAKAAALSLLKNDLKHLREISSSVHVLYAKPSTNDGLRLLKKYRFRPIDGENGIWTRKLFNIAAQ